MTDNMMPELTLTPDDTATAAAVEVPSLTLTPEAPEVPKEEEKKIEPVEMDDKLLTEEEKQAVEAFSHKIDIRDTNQVLQYGAAAQKSVASFSENALNNVRSKDMGEIGEDLSRLVVELKGFGEEDEKKGLFGLFKKAGNKLETMKAQYSKVEANVDKIAQNLENHQITLLKDVAMFDQMYELNLKYYKELTMYILAGKRRLAEVRDTELPALKARAEQTGAQHGSFADVSPFDHDAAAADEAFVLDDYGRALDRFQYAADAHAAAQVDVFADLRARSDRGPCVHERTGVDIGADVHVTGHQDRSRRQVCAVTGHCGGDDAHAEAVESVFERNFIVVLHRSGRLGLDPLDRKIEQNSLFHPLVDTP